MGVAACYLSMMRLGGCSVPDLYRYQIQRGPVCSVHPSESATLQCTACSDPKTEIPESLSYHCSSECFKDAWPRHRIMHDQASESLPNGGITSSASSGITSSSSSKKGQQPGVNSQEPVIGHSRTYTPTVDDIGHFLRFECAPVNALTRLPCDTPTTVMTSYVIRAPSPIPRSIVEVNKVDVTESSNLDGQIASSGTFRVLSYNILSDSYATSELYGYCPSWALSWFYRRQNLLREIISYDADIICLQEVQSGQHEDFFAPELNKYGYEALYKSKTSETDRLLTGLERIAACKTMSVLVCGDLNSFPGSAPHALLTKGKVDESHPNMPLDPIHILNPPSKMNHKLPLVKCIVILSNGAVWKENRSQDKRTSVHTLYQEFDWYC